MLLDELDKTDEFGCSGAFRLLQRVRSEGMITAVDLVSTEHRNYAAIVKSALPATDILFINELEASRVLGRSLSAGDVSALQEAACGFMGLWRAAGSRFAHGKGGRLCFAGWRGLASLLGFAARFQQGSNGRRGCLCCWLASWDA
jgi:hypothetical protein